MGVRMGPTDHEPTLTIGDPDPVLDRQARRHEEAKRRARRRLWRLRALLFVPFAISLVIALIEITRDDPNDVLVMATFIGMIPFIASFDWL